ncbi:hypothetical protein H5410_052397, partial [Solanum commersonii]
DPLAKLVEIADTFRDSPFGRFHRLPTLTFSLFTSPRTRTKGDLQADRRLANWVRRSSGHHFFVLFSRLVPSCQVVSMLCLKHQIPET